MLVLYSVSQLFFSTFTPHSSSIIPTALVGMERGKAQGHQQSKSIKHNVLSEPNRRTPDKNIGLLRWIFHSLPREPSYLSSVFFSFSFLRTLKYFILFCFFLMFIFLFWKWEYEVAGANPFLLFRVQMAAKRYIKVYMCSFFFPSCVDTTIISFLFNECSLHFGSRQYFEVEVISFQSNYSLEISSRCPSLAIQQSPYIDLIHIFQETRTLISRFVIIPMWVQNLMLKQAQRQTCSRSTRIYICVTKVRGRFFSSFINLAENSKTLFISLIKRSVGVGARVRGRPIWEIGRI